MAVTFVEDHESRSATIVRKGMRGESTYTKSWKAFGTTDDTVLHREINSQLSSLYGWQYPDNQTAKLWVDSYTVTYLGDEAWQVTANYRKTGIDDETRRDPFHRSRSFDTGGGTMHVTQGRTTTITATDGGYQTVTTVPERRYPSNAPDMLGAIGVDDNGVSGVDVGCPSLQWSEDYEVPASYVTSLYIKKLAGLAYTTNSGNFRGFSPGEVLFTGCSGSQEWDSDRGDGPWKLTYKFVASPNDSNITVGSITGVEKKGHEYMWVLYQSDADSSTKTLLKKPKFVYVNKVYRDGDFSQLGIGVA